MVSVLDRWLRRHALALLVLGAACGSQTPTGPGTPTPPPVTPPPPSIQLNWPALTGLFDDPLFRQQPLLLDDQAAAAPLNSAIQHLIQAIAARNYDLTRGALVDLAGARQAYGLSISGMQADRLVLTTISLFEMRAWSYVNAATPAIDVPLASSVDERAVGEVSR